MARRFSKFKQVTSPPQGARSESVVREITAPFLGMRPDKSRHELLPGESGDMLNFLVERGRLRMRPSLSSITRPSIASSTLSVLNDTTASLLAALEVPENPNSSNYFVLAFVSKNTTSNSSILGYNMNAGWQNLTQNSAVSLIGFGANYHAVTVRFPDLNSGQLSWIASNNWHSSPLLPITGSWEDRTSAVTHLPNYSSVASAGGYVATFDDRVLVSGEVINASRKEQRVRWTARGTATDWTSIGAGLEDINSMQGRITMMYPESSRLLIFSESEIWQGTPRRDDYAFDFDIVADDAGLSNPKFLVATDSGPFWVHRNTLFRLVGNVPRKVSRSLQKELLAFEQMPDVSGFQIQSVVYARRTNTIWLLFGDVNDGYSYRGYAVHLDTLTNEGEWDELVWTKHSLNLPDNVGITAGHEGRYINAVSDAPSGLNRTESAGATFPELGAPAFMVDQSANSLVVRTLPFAGGSGDTAEFTTHIPEGARDSRRFDMLREVGFDYEISGSTVSAWVGVSANIGDSFTTVGEVALSSGKGHKDVAITPLRVRNPLVKLAFKSLSSSTCYIDRITFEGRAWTGRR